MFNVDNDIEEEPLKTYITTNETNVIELSRLSKPEWNRHSYRVVTYYSEKENIMSDEFWPQDTFYETQRRNKVKQSETMIISDNLNICSLNCEGLKRSFHYISSFFIQNNNCDILCVQELWILECNLKTLVSLSEDYLEYILLYLVLMIRRK